MENDIKTITNDPYLNTARLTIKNKRYRDLYIKKRIDRNFLKKKIDIDEYIFMSKGVSTLLFGLIFIYLPYLLGVIFIFIFISGLQLHIFERLNYTFTLFWAIGYEIVAIFILLSILKSTFNFGKGGID